MKESPERLSEELRRLADRAEAFADEPDLAEALSSALRDERAWEEAEADPARFLEAQGIQTPEGLAVRFLRDPLQMPAPDYEFFTIRFTRCRSYWVKKRDGIGYEQVQVCRGFEIVPHPLPPIA